MKKSVIFALAIMRCLSFWRNGSPDSYREVEAAVTADSYDWRNGRVVDRGSLENC